MNIVGHKTQIEQLKSLQKRMPHALLLSGPKGVGKRLIAQKLASDLLGSAKLESHPDFRLLRAAEGKKDITAAQVRELASELNLKPY